MFWKTYQIVVLFLVQSIPTILAQNFCYSCNGKTASVGQDCNLDNLCYGSVCYYAITANGSWVAGCGNANDSFYGVQLSTSGCSYGTNSAVCGCQTNLCNNLFKMAPQVGNFTPVKAADQNLLTCFECGTGVGSSGHSLNITCDGLSTCIGVACLTRRSVSPRSYCVSSWNGALEIGCTKDTATDELCVCKQDMCNYPYDPMTMIATPSTTPSTLPNGTVVCPDGRHFGPNEQAVYAGEKLKSIILNNFGHFAGTDALNNFNIGIDFHICNYKNK
uniref:Sodefrin-like factor n=1 Tax=Panagrolaimus sp. JU765 TaxID=591449 RepID=A0AC34Q2C3_9BILA